VVKASSLVSVAVIATVAACGSGNAPHGRVADCGTISYRGDFVAGGEAAAHVSAACFVRAVHACTAARLQVNVMGVDTGTTKLLTVRRARHHTCVTSVTDTSFVLTQRTRRHEVCDSVAAAVDGVVLSNCHRK